MRIVFATMTGVISSFVVIILVEMLSHLFYPPPKGIDYNDMKVLADYVKTLPLGAFILPIVAHALGIFSGMTIARIIDRTSMVPQYILSGFLVFGTVMNAFSLPHPKWFLITDIIIVLVAGYFGIIIAKKKLQS